MAASSSSIPVTAFNPVASDDRSWRVVEKTVEKTMKNQKTEKPAMRTQEYLELLSENQERFIGIVEKSFLSLPNYDRLQFLPVQSQFYHYFGVCMAGAGKSTPMAHLLKILSIIAPTTRVTYAALSGSALQYFWNICCPSRG